MKTLKIEVDKVKKFDIIELLDGSHTVDYLRMCKGYNYCKIYYMDGSITFCLLKETVEVKRDKFYSLTNKVYDTKILNILQ